MKHGALLLSSCLVATLIFTGCSRSPQANTAPHASAANEHAGHNMSMTATTDREFLQGMIPHHEEAVETSKFVLQQTENAELKSFLTKVITTQTKEINDMKEWYGEWFSSEYVADGTYMPMMGDLTGISGKELEKVYLEGMIKHHQGAVQMADSILPKAQHPEVKNLAENIKKTQTEEIDQMEEWLKKL